MPDTNLLASPATDRSGDLRCVETGHDRTLNHKPYSIVPTQSALFDWLENDFQFDTLPLAQDDDFLSGPRRTTLDYPS